MNMEVRLFGIFNLLLTLFTPQFCRGTRMKRQMSNFHHPAYSMFAHSPVSFPGLSGGHTSGYSESQCIMGDIVCPSWCLMEDDWGCKYCPCGPASGMSPPVISEGRTGHHEPQHECLGTMLCMLTCKDGYRLGPRREQGCQSCYCKKNTTTRVTTTPIPITTTVKETTTTNMNSSLLHTSGQSPSSSSKDCKWPLCMNAKTPHEGPHAGSTSSNSAGGFVSPGDCFGPSCSAKNGMRLVNQFGGSNGNQHGQSGTMRIPTTPLVPTPGITRRCPLTDECVRSCPDNVQLAPPTEPGGCPICRCVKTETVAPTATPTRMSCPSVNKCKVDCISGYQIIPSKSNDGCPGCSCIEQKVPVLPPIPTPKPNYLTMCSETVHCMETCHHGYTLTPSDKDGCPICTCNIEPTVQHTVDTAAETCPATVRCIVNCGSDQYTLIAVPGQICPTCDCQENLCGSTGCIRNTTKKPSSVNISPGQCMAILHCVMTCRNGYDVGDNDKDGCPTCICIP